MNPLHPENKRDSNPTHSQTPVMTQPNSTMVFFHPRNPRHRRKSELFRISMSLILFAWFAVPSAPAQPTNDNDTVYLFSTFKEGNQDGLRFAYSYDGYHWSNVPGLFLKARIGEKPIMRDPSIVRGPDGTWHLVWTSAWRGNNGFGYSSSKDLVHWSEQKFIPVMAHEPTVVNVWAPELFYDDTENRFIICWASTVPGRFPDYLEAATNNHRMYYTTTRDFHTFTPTKLFLDPGFSVIDCQIISTRSSGRESAQTSSKASNGANSHSLLQESEPAYVLILKDNTRPQRNIRVAFGDTPLGPWRDISPPFTEKLTEGPTSLKLGDDWFIYFDSYGTKSYGAVKTRDFKTFTDVSAEMTFPEGLKHGTIFKATKKDLDYLWKVSNSMVPGVGHKFVPKLFPAEIDARLAAIERIAQRGPFQPTWESITNKFRTPKWYQDAKFGLFIHWGAYAVPAFGSEWYPRNMYVTNSPEFAHHVATYGPQSQFGYKDFFPHFRAEKFDATAWAKLFKEAGVKYVVPVAEHHDGFPMYNSELTDWTATKLGPRRDVIAEQAKAFRKAGITFGASSHRAEHWFFFDNGMYFDSDVRNPRFADLYGPAVNKRTAEAQAEPPTKEFLDDWLLRSCEIVDKYRPEVIYFDWWICQPVFQPYLKTFAAYYYNRGVEWKKQVAINFKEWEGISFPRGSGVFDMERGAAADIQPEFWQTCTSVSRNSWGYITNHIYKNTDEIVDELVDVVSKNGTLLLNIGPRADGTIPEREQEMLREIGAWLKINGEAIYGTRPWHKFGEGPTLVAEGSFTDKQTKAAFTAADFRFTTKGNTLYAIALAWPENRQLLVKSLAGQSVRRVQLLGHRGRLVWKETPEGLAVTLPETPSSNFAVTLKITGQR
jgi:alpha-L-fucosidase